MAPFEAEEFWDDLLAFIEEGRVIPVVGAELLTIQQEGSPAVPLYPGVADRLLTLHKVNSPPQEHYGLYEAVSAVAGERRVRMKDLYRQIYEILKTVIAEQRPALRAVARAGFHRPLQFVRDHHARRSAGAHADCRPRCSGRRDPVCSVVVDRQETVQTAVMPQAGPDTEQESSHSCVSVAFFGAARFRTSPNCLSQACFFKAVCKVFLPSHR